MIGDSKMFCPKCGTNVNDGARFCPVCGNDMAVQQPQAPTGYPRPQEQMNYTQQQAPVNYAQPQEQFGYAQPQESVPPMGYAPMVEDAPKGNKGLKVALIAIIAVLVIGAIGVGAYFLISNSTSGSSNEETKECKECGEEFEGSGKLCDDCKEKEEKTAECEECGAEFQGEGKLCEECQAALDAPAKACNQCGDDMEGDALICSSCLSGIDYTNNYEDGQLGCFYCGTDMDEADVAIVDTDGFVYCKACDTGNYCSGCNMPIERGDDDTECKYCADFSCYTCDEVLTEDEIAGQDDEGYCYCENCW